MCTWSTLSTTLCCVHSLSCFRTLWREGQSWLVVAGYAQDCLRVPVFKETLNVQEAPAQRRMKVWSSPSLSSPSLLLFRLLPYPLLTAVCLALFPDTEKGEEKECLVFTVCTCASSLRRLSSYIYWWCHIITALCVSWCSALYRAVLGLLVARGLKIKLKKEQVTSNECGNIPLCCDFSKSIPTTAYQTFHFVSDSIKLGRACSSDVYSVLKNKSFYDSLCYSCELLVVILVQPHNSTMWPLLQLHTCTNSVYQAHFLLPLLHAWERG